MDLGQAVFQHEKVKTGQYLSRPVELQATLPLSHLIILTPDRQLGHKLGTWHENSPYVASEDDANIFVKNCAFLLHFPGE